MENELPGVLDGADEPATVEELEAVVRRAGQRRRATLMAGAAALLVVGAVGGALARGPIDDSQVGFAGSPRPAQQSTTVPPDQVMSSSGPMGPGVALTPLFRREANGVVIRAYRTSFPIPVTTIPVTTIPVPPGNPACAPPASVVQGELSSSAAVAWAMGPERKPDTMAVLGMGEFGREEGAPATWAIVRAGAGVARVRVTAGAASDVMDPQNGIALLAIPGDRTGGKVEWLGVDGKVLGTQPLTLGASPAPDPACMPTSCVDGPPPPTTAPTVPATAPLVSPRPTKPGFIEGHTCAFGLPPGVVPADTVPGRAAPTAPPPFGPKVTSVPALPTSSAPPLTTAWPTTSTAKPNAAP